MTAAGNISARVRLFVSFLMSIRACRSATWFVRYSNLQPASKKNTNPLQTPKGTDHRSVTGVTSDRIFKSRHHCLPKRRFAGILRTRFFLAWGLWEYAKCASNPGRYSLESAKWHRGFDQSAAVSTLMCRPSKSKAKACGCGQGSVGLLPRAAGYCFRRVRERKTRLSVRPFFSLLLRI